MAAAEPFALVQQCEIAQIAVTMRAGAVRGEHGPIGNFENAVEIAACDFSPAREMRTAPVQIIIEIFLTTPGLERRQVADCRP